MHKGRLWLLIFSLSAAARAQTQVDLRTQSKSVDFSFATSTKPMKTGTLLPSICSVGEMFFKSDALPGANVYSCSALNSWVQATPALGGDLSGTVSSALVTQLQGRPVLSAAPGAGQFLGWNVSTGRWEPLMPPAGTTLPSVGGRAGSVLATDGSSLFWSFPAGDINGAISGTTVVRIQNQAVSATLPMNGQVLTWNGSTVRWEPQAPPVGGSGLPTFAGNAGRLLTTDGSGALWASVGGDLFGSISALTVTRLQGRNVSSTSPVSGQFLGWNAVTSQWEPQAPPVGGSGLPGFSGNGGKLLTTDGSGAFWAGLGGDLSGTIASVTVSRLQGRTVSGAGPSTGQFLGWNGISNQWEPQVPPVGTVLPSYAGNANRLLTTDGSSPLWSGVGGDLNGPISSTTVARLQGRNVSSAGPVSGQFLGWNGSTNQWEPQNAPVGGTGLPSVSGNAGKLLGTDGANPLWTAIGGDLSGPITSATVSKLQNRSVSTAQPAAAQVLGWNASGFWEPQTSAVGGDLTGSVPSATVAKLQGRAVSAAGPGSGQVLTWNASTNQWEPQTVATSGGSNLPSSTGNAGRLLSTDGTNPFWSALGGDLLGPIGNATVTHFQGRPISSQGPQSGQFLGWNDAGYWEARTPPSSSGSTLPTVTGNSGRLLSTDGTSAFWSALGGDLLGPIGNATVTHFQGRPISSQGPQSGQFLGWNDAGYWEARTPPSSGGSTLPTVTGNAGRLLTTDGTNLRWSVAGGDLNGSITSATVTRLQGRTVASTGPAGGQVLTWNATTNQWEPQTVAAGGSSLPSLSGNANKVLATDGSTAFWLSPGGDLSGSLGTATVVQLQGRPMASTAPGTGQVLTWNGLTGRWEPQTPATSGGGSGGAALASQLGDFAVTRSNATTLAVGAGCAFSTPCNVRIGGVTYSFTSGATIGLTGGTGFAYVYIDKTGTLSVGHNLTLSCSSVASGGCSAVSGVTSFPTDAIPLWIWSATNGSWDALGMDQRAAYTTRNIAPGTGLVTTETPGLTTIAADPSVIGLRLAVPSTSGAACSMGNWAVDANFYYICVSVNTWKRTAISSW